MPREPARVSSWASPQRTSATYQVYCLLQPSLTTSTPTREVCSLASTELSAQCLDSARPADTETLTCKLHSKIFSPVTLAQSNLHGKQLQKPPLLLADARRGRRFGKRRRGTACTVQRCTRLGTTSLATVLVYPAVLASSNVWKISV